MTSYQRLKAENEQLKKDIYNLIRNADKIEGMETKMRYEMSYSLSDVVWAGNPADVNLTSFSGLCNTIKALPLP